MRTRTATSSSFERNMKALHQIKSNPINGKKKNDTDTDASMQSMDEKNAESEIIVEVKDDEVKGVG